MPGKGHHTAKFDRCVEQVMAKGNEKSSAYAICTTQFQKSGEEILNAEQSRGLHLVGATGKARHDTWNGKPYLVVPTIMLMEGVIHAVNASTPEFVPKSLIETDPSQWDGHPILLGHAVKGGKQCSAHDDAIQAAQRFGTIRNTYYKDGKLGSESWCDLARLKELGRDDVVKRLEENDPIQVSVGAFVASDSSKKSEFKGKKYEGEWLAYRSDHLAFLPDGRGACSLEMGCGTHRAATMRVLEDRLEVETPELRAAAGARHSSSDMKVIQQVHDHATTLGAKCAASNTKFMSYASRSLQGPSLDERMRLVSDAVQETYGVTPGQGGAVMPSNYAYSQAIYDDHVIYRSEEKLWSVDYEINKDGEIDFTSEPFEVRQEYVAAASYKDCPTCDGSGQVKKDGKQEDCPTCDGKGEIIKAAEMRAACGHCDGACTCQHRAAIKREGGKYVLYSKDGSRRLGTHDTEADAIAHNSAVDAAKKRRDLERAGVTH